MAQMSYCSLFYPSKLRPRICHFLLQQGHLLNLQIAGRRFVSTYRAVYITDIVT